MDPRTTQTQANIKGAFLELIKEKPIAKISVSQLCSKIGVPRQTFYYHYSDCQALVESVVKDEAERIAKLFGEHKDNTIQLVEDAMAILKEDEQLYLRLNEAGLRELLFSVLLEKAYSNYFAQWKVSHSEWTDPEMELSFRFAAAGLYEVLFKQNDNISDEERVAFIAKTIESHQAIINQ